MAIDCTAYFPSYFDSIPPPHEQEYKGYRLHLTDLKILRQKGKDVKIQYTLINTGRENIALGGKKAINDNLLVLFDQSLQTAKLDSYQQQIRKTLLQQQFSIVAGQIKRNNELSFSTKSIPIVEEKVEEMVSVKSEKVEEMVEEVVSDEPEKAEKEVVDLAPDKSIEAVKKKKEEIIATQPEKVEEMVSAKPEKVEEKVEEVVSDEPEKAEKEVVDLAPDKSIEAVKKKKEEIIATQPEKVEEMVSAKPEKVEEKVEEVVSDEPEKAEKEVVDLAPDKSIEAVKKKKEEIIATQSEKVEEMAAKGEEKTKKLGSDKSQDSEEDYTPYLDRDNCSDLFIEDIKIVKRNKRSVTLEYSLVNKGTGPAYLFGSTKSKEDNVAIRANISGSTRLSRGAIIIGGDYITAGLKKENGKLMPNERYTGTLKLDTYKMTKFTPNIILELDAYNSLIECDETNNRSHIKVE